MVAGGYFLLLSNASLSAQKTATGTIIFSTYSITTNSSSEGISEFYTNTLTSLPQRTITVTIKAKTGYEITNLICQTTTGSTISLSGLQNDKTTFTMPSCDVIISATATPNTYTVTFDANGGSTSLSAKDVIYDSTFGTLPDATRLGYTFVGWYTDRTSGTQITANTKVQILNNITLYARYLANQYNIIYEGNGASIGTMQDSVATYDQVAQLQNNAFTYKSKITLDYGYDIADGELISERPFSGWCASVVGGEFGATSALGSDITSTSTVIADGSYVKNLAASGDVTLTAQWGEATKQPLPTPTRSKYKFACWCYYADGLEVKIASGSIGATSDITVYAKWVIVEIQNASDLNEFAQTVNGTCQKEGIVDWKCSYENITVSLKTNVALNDTSNVSNWATSAPANSWTPIGYYNSDDDNTTFIGTFEGGGYTISGIYVNTPTQSYKGLFATLGEGSVVKNLTINNSYIRAMREVGGIAGFALGTTIQNCKNYATICAIGDGNDSNDNVGGIIGELRGTESTIQNCVNYGSITTTNDSLGGIVGRGVQGTISGCRNAGLVSSTTSAGVGGIVGFARYELTISGCYTDSSSVVSASSNVAGIVGYMHGDSVKLEVINCYNLGKVSATAGRAGGIAGYASENSTITSCYNSGEITSTGTSNSESGLAGIVGWNYMGTITKCYNTGKISGQVAVGGIAGYNCGTVTECYNTGSIYGESIVGGVVAYLQGGDAGDPIVKNCYNAGAVSSISSSSMQVGGVIGYINAGENKTIVVSNVYNRGTITGYDYVGGVVGEFYSDVATGNITLKDSYNVGSIVINDGAANPFVGGLVGITFNASTATMNMEYCVSQGTITCSKNVGALVGYAYNVSTGTINMNKIYISSSFSYYYPYATSTGTINRTNVNTGSVSLTTQSRYSSTTYWSSSSSWDFTNVWKISSSTNGGYPIFTWQ